MKNERVEILRSFVHFPHIWIWKKKSRNFGYNIFIIIFWIQYIFRLHFGFWLLLAFRNVSRLFFFYGFDNENVFITIIPNPFSYASKVSVRASDNSGQ